MRSTVLLVAVALCAVHSASALNHCIVRAHSTPQGDNDLVGYDVEAVAATTLMREFLTPNQYLLVRGVGTTATNAGTELDTANWLYTCAIGHFQGDAVIVINFHGSVPGVTWYTTVLYLFYVALTNAKANPPNLRIIYSSCNSPWGIEEGKVVKECKRTGHTPKAFKKWADALVKAPNGQNKRGSHIVMKPNNDGSAVLGLKMYETEAPSPSLAMTDLSKLANPKNSLTPSAAFGAVSAYSQYLLSALNDGTSQQFVTWEKAFPDVYKHAPAELKAFKGSLINAEGTGASAFVQLRTSLHRLRQRAAAARRARALTPVGEADA